MEAFLWPWGATTGDSFAAPSPPLASRSFSAEWEQDRHVMISSIAKMFLFFQDVSLWAPEIGNSVDTVISRMAESQLICGRNLTKHSKIFTYLRCVLGTKRLPSYWLPKSRLFKELLKETEHYFRRRCGIYSSRPLFTNISKIPATPSYLRYRHGALLS